MVEEVCNAWAEFLCGIAVSGLELAQPLSQERLFNAGAQYDF